MTIPLNKKTVFRILRFGLVGIFNTLFDLLVLNGLIYAFGIRDPFHFSIYKGISFGCALVCSYFLNTYFTFKKNETSKKGFSAFVFFSLIGFVVNITLSSLSFYVLNFYSGTLSVHLTASISALIGAVFSAVVNYLTYSYFVFK